MKNGNVSIHPGRLERGLGRGEVVGPSWAVRGPAGMSPSGRKISDFSVCVPAGLGLCCASTSDGPVAQLDRALPSEGRGRWFESIRVRQVFQRPSCIVSWAVVVSGTPCSSPWTPGHAAASPPSDHRRGKAGSLRPPRPRKRRNPVHVGGDLRCAHIVRRRLDDKLDALYAKERAGCDPPRCDVLIDHHLGIGKGNRSTGIIDRPVGVPDMVEEVLQGWPPGLS